MKTKHSLFSVLIFLCMAQVFVACKDDDTDSEMMLEARFKSEKIGEMEMEILIDTKTDLVWVNDARGCFAAIIDPTTPCAELTFAGQSDWRISTPEELVALLTEVSDRNMSLNYINSNCKLMSSSEKVWVFTKNSDLHCMTTINEPGNAGLRCVRSSNYNLKQYLPQTYHG